MNKNIFLLIISMVLVVPFSNAQQDAQFTQYMYNPLSFNPAYAGSRDVLSAVLIHRSQWLGVQGAPTTQHLSGHSPINETMSVGLNIMRDEVGPMQENTIQASYSYGIFLNRSLRLNFGLQLGANLLDVDFNKLSIRDPNDPNFAENIDNKFSPQFGLGAMLYDENYYVGISVPNLVETEHFDQSNNSNSKTLVKEKASFYLTGGYVWQVSPNLKFKPTLLSKITTGSPLQIDISTNFLLYDKFTLGAAYRWDSAISALAAFQISDSWLIGVAYDMETTSYSAYNNGSLEAFLRFELFKKYNKMLTPLFF